VTPQQRRATIITLLDHWQDFFDTVSGRPTTVASDEGGGLPLLSSMSSHRSVVELGRCLADLRRVGPRHYAHLRGFYDAEWRITQQPVRRKTIGGGRVIVETKPVRARIVPSWVDVGLAERAVDVLAGLFHGTPEVPIALLRGMTGELREYVDPVSGEHGWTEAA
jgi:hypothetical protein